MSFSQLGEGKVDRGPRHARVAAVIREQIETGLLKDGQSLPSSRQLAAEMGVSTSTVTNAIKLLVADGLVETRQRSRSVVIAPDTLKTDIKLKSSQVVFVSGHDGSGKSEFASELAKLTGWVVYEKDQVLRPVVEELLLALGASPNDRDSTTYRQKVEPKEREVVDVLVRRNAKLGLSVIVVGEFLTDADFDWLREQISELSVIGAQPKLVWVDTTADEMFDRLRSQGASRHARRIDDWATYLESIDLSWQPEMVNFLASPQSGSFRVPASDFLRRLTSGQWSSE